MELELNRRQLGGFDTLADVTLFSEETMECIVPDACPDILRVLDTRGSVRLKTKEVMEGRVEVRGTICLSVLYLPDGEAGVRRVEVNIPFHCGMDLPAARPDCRVHAVPRLFRADTRILNPRKVYVRAEAAVPVRVYAPCLTELAGCCAGGEKWGLQERVETHRPCLVTAVAEKPFSFSEDLTLPGGKPEVEEVLSHRVELQGVESKVIGSKLIVKGQAALTVLYRGGEEGPHTAAFELPFSQIVEMEEAGEDGECGLELTVSDVSCQVDPEDGRTLSVSMSLLAQAVLREQRSMEVLRDLYSTGWELDTEMKRTEVSCLVESAVRRQSVREVLEATVAVQTVLDCELSFGQVTQTWEGRTLVIAVEARAGLLYRGEDNGLYALNRSIPASCRLELEPDCQCVCRCECPGELYATPAMNGVEVRFPLDFHYRAERREAVTEVAQARLDETRPCDATGRPSLILRKVEAGESLWDVAKAYTTTKADIMRVNELSEEGDCAGKMLLIPKIR